MRKSVGSFIVAPALMWMAAGAFAQAAVGVGSWSTVHDPGPGRFLPSVTSMRDGRVLIAGGRNTSNYLNTNEASAEIFDGATNTFVAIPPMSIGRYQQTATVLPDGRVLVVGGTEDNVNPLPLRSAEIYDPSTNTWTPTGSMKTSRFGHEAALLHDGRVLIMGGTQDVYNDLSSCEIWDPATGRWSSTGSMGIGRRYSVAVTLQDGSVMEVGDGVGSEVYSPKTGTWAPTGPEPLPPALYPAVALLDNGTVFQSPGITDSTGPSALYVGPRNVWKTVRSRTLSRDYPAFTRLADGSILIAGGCVNRCSDQDVNSVVRYLPSTREFVDQASLNYGRESAAAVTLPDGRALVYGDANGHGPEIFTPN